MESIFQPTPTLMINRSKAAINQTWHSREGYKPSVPWLRARERYRLRNSMTGVILICFIGGVCTATLFTLLLTCLDWYTIKAVDQDTFEDVPMPPPPTLPTAYPGVRHRNIDDSLKGVKKKG